MVEENKKTALGITENLEALLCYALGWISGLVFLIVEKENEFVRFHALQSLVTFGAFHVISFVILFVPFIGFLISFLIGMLSLAVWIIMMIKSYAGERYKLPVVGDFVEQQLAKK